MTIDRDNPREMPLDTLIDKRDKYLKIAKFLKDSNDVADVADAEHYVEYASKFREEIERRVHGGC